tara:strand:- start:3092 stop:3307 length:216 start_codon:yes stop_codon:yes gene_type:complete
VGRAYLTRGKGKTMAESNEQIIAMIYTNEKDWMQIKSVVGKINVQFGYVVNDEDGLEIDSHLNPNKKYEVQ